MIARFLGLWRDAGGRTLWIEADGEGARVSVAAGLEAPWAERPPLLGHLRPGRACDMPAALTGESRLVVEAGSPGVGPTFQLECEGDALMPSVHLGLYDDFEDDLGVPWALPLTPYRRADAAEAATWQARRRS